MSAAGLLEGRRICICVGAGGVGKTTTAAAIGIGMAKRGKRVAVVTIDPARRLANALGLEQLDNEPVRISAAALERLTAPDEPPLSGELWAMMLDPKQTFDELIDRLAPSPERAAEIKRNGVYRQLSSAISGSQEFTAIEKLYELAEADFDLLVLDTPPAHSAAEFLNAPGRLSAFLGGGALQVLLRPAGLGMRLLGVGAAPLLKALRLVTGVDLLSDLTAFFGLLGGMTEEFNARALRVQDLLRSDQTAFLLVTSAQDRPIEEAVWFRQTLRERGMPFAGAVVNRVNAPVPRGEVPLDLPTGPAFPPDLAARLDACLADHAVLAQRDATNIERLRTAFAGEPILLVPELAVDIHDAEGLLAIHRELFDE